MPIQSILHLLGLFIGRQVISYSCCLGLRFKCKVKPMAKLENLIWIIFLGMKLGEYHIVLKIKLECL
jgi:uncharacterized membrane protein YccF (DUF307 family)